MGDGCSLRGRHNDTRTDFKCNKIVSLLRKDINQVGYMYIFTHIQVCVLVLILLFLLLCLFFSFGFACYFSVHHFCWYMSRRTNSAGSIHCWKCKVLIVIMMIIAIMIAIIRPISCDNVMMIKHLEILHYLG